MSQEMAAAKLAIDRRTLSNYETGERTPPPEVVRAAARLYKAPELLLALHDESPLAGMALSSDALEAIGWLKEELREALAAAERKESLLRRGEACEDADLQIYDVLTALTSYFVVRARQGLDLEALMRRHRRKVADRYGGRRKLQVAVA